MQKRTRCPSRLPLFRIRHLLKILFALRQVTKPNTNCFPWGQNSTKEKHSMNLKWQVKATSILNFRETDRERPLWSRFQLLLSYQTRILLHPQHLRQPVKEPYAKGDIQNTIGRTGLLYSSGWMRQNQPLQTGGLRQGSSQTTQFLTCQPMMRRWGYQQSTDNN